MLLKCTSTTYSDNHSKSTVFLQYSTFVSSKFDPIASKLPAIFTREMLSLKMWTVQLLFNNKTDLCKPSVSCLENIIPISASFVRMHKQYATHSVCQLTGTFASDKNTEIFADEEFKYKHCILLDSYIDFLIP